MTANTDSELEDLLARLEKAHPAVAERQLQLEVDDLLGRESKPEHLSSRRTTRSEQSANPLEEGSWQRHLFRRLPAPLNHESAVEHARSVEAGLYAEQLISTIELGKAEGVYLETLHAVSVEGKLSFDYLVLCNLRLVYFWCRRIAGSLDDNWMQDAFQAGCIGLIRGLQGWDYSRGALSTYVSWHIRQQIQRWRMNDIDVVRVPVHVWERLSSTPEDLSEDVMRSAQNAFGIKYVSDFSVSELEKANGGSDPGKAYDGGISSLVEKISLRQILASLFPLLSDREVGVLLRRHGLSPKYSEPSTLQEIGHELGVTRERIRQIERDALKKLRESDDLRTAWESFTR